VRVHALRLQAGAYGRTAEDEERARACERAALGVQEELGAVASIEMRPPAREVAPDRFRRLPPDRDDPLLVAFAPSANEPRVEVDRAPHETDGLADTEPGGVEELEQGGVAQRSRRGSGRSLEDAFDVAV
jgi:hypothetical protein